jgi:peptide deformylase
MMVLKTDGQKKGSEILDSRIELPEIVVGQKKGGVKESEEHPEYHMRFEGSPSLMVKCVEVTDFSNLDGLLATMRKIAVEYDCVGLSANQVGDNRRVILVKVDGETMALINPEIESGRGYMLGRETCASVPFEEVVKSRKIEVDVKYQDTEGKQHRRTFKEEAAVTIQHELDHIKGKLITDSPWWKLLRKMDL